MSNYRFKLEPYKGVRTRHTCPACERSRCFAHYIDTEGTIEFPDNVGRCDHEQSCGYHCTPKDYFAKHPLAKEDLYSSDRLDYNKQTPVILPPSFIEKATMEQTLRGYKQNNLYCFLSEQLGEDEALQLLHSYHVGTSKHWEGATVFWQIDTIGRVRTGKIMLYNPENGKRVKQPFNHITWAHSLLKLPNYNLSQCFFGEHLLDADKQKPIALVESEKTALIASHYLPQYLWLATGGKNGCFKSSNLSPLFGRQIVLFPDLGATAYWEEKLHMMQRLGMEVQLFDYLEKHATSQDQQAGYDIADYLLQIKTQNSALKDLIRQNPNLQLLVDKLGLQVVKEQRLAHPLPQKRRLHR
ncbi:hypothetical protein HQ45_01770 [Porphyromonas crevioricanis]|uniref:DUF6371 domain-containing protein n=1 Tax=Porphyromonas crevioricanis TaxID=393921 RepID=UPI00052BEE7E|nr:DUF6371 domain-containing protein [Porphyromonas crevioricanis]KGN90869.1 hypothetical protein HQ45_01770 [Porphyromonas crevioricanis]